MLSYAVSGRLRTSRMQVGVPKYTRSTTVLLALYLRTLDIHVHLRTILSYILTETPKAIKLICHKLRIVAKLRLLE